VADGVGIAPTQPGGSLGFRDRGITALPTIRRKSGCQGWTRTNTVRFNKPSCYFDTTWHLKCKMQNGECKILHSSFFLLHFRVALPAGLAPASVRLEDERLVCFGHGSIQMQSEERGMQNQESAGLRGPNSALYILHSTLEMVVGTAGFSPATSRSQAGRSED
jgi:hypothetical protein